MKTKELKTKIASYGLTEDQVEELSAYILAANGVDVNNAKANSTDEIEQLKNENTSLKEQISNFKDYEDLKKYKEDSEAAIEKTRKSEFLKGQKVKDGYADILMDKIDWSKGKYDAEKKTYTGLDDQIKSSKESYKDLFEVEQVGGSISFNAGDSGSTAKSTPNQSMNNFIRGL